MIALENMVDVTLRRLIVSVPYERTPQALFGRRQAFDEESLRTWGAWCVEKLGGAATGMKISAVGFSWWIIQACPPIDS